MSLIYYVDSEPRESTQPEPNNGKEDEAETAPQQTDNDTQQHSNKVPPEVIDSDERGMATYTCKQCIDAHARI